MILGAVGFRDQEAEALTPQGLIQHATRGTFDARRGEASCSLSLSLPFQGS